MSDPYVADASSRYSSVMPILSWDRRDTSLGYSVFRVPPLYPKGYIRFHSWIQGDRWDMLAAKYLGDPGRWWVLLDFNPDIYDPLFVEPGTVITIPAPAPAES